LAIIVQPFTDDWRRWVRERTQELFNGVTVISRGRAHEPAALAGFVALDGAEPVGVTTYEITDSLCELVTIDALRQWQGIGTLLISAVEDAAAQKRCREIWLITTNDNIDALRFYQKRGYQITKVHANALEESRKLKPAIPLIGNYGIPIRDEIELAKVL
jgi:ribosomal protein S18 acetylase RimI-like enzyme